MSDKLTQNLTEATVVDTTSDRVPIYSAASPSELRYMTPNNLVPDASATVKGKVELATTAETETGTDATRAVTPDSYRDAFATTEAAIVHAATEKTTPADADELGLIDSAASYVLKKLTWANLKATLLTWLRLSTTIIPTNAPQGFLINGKISVTDTGSGLTVAIKTLAGTDPSATDPVYCRIGDTIRTISAALSVTKADGTNWLKAGSAELATKEVDYFVYLFWDSVNSAVKLGFSRFPGAAVIGDFNVNQDNEKGICIEAGGTLTAADTCELIGRFAATLSAGAGYTWSVPTYTASNLIQRPIYETRWLDYAPVEVGWSGTLTFALASYKITMNQLFLNLNTNNGTSDSATTSLTVPFSSVNEYSFANALAIDNGSVVATANRAVISAGAATLTFYKDMASTGWTSSGTKRVGHMANYEI